MLSKIWDNIKAAVIVFGILIAAFMGYFLIIFGTIAVIALGLFFVIRVLIYDDINQDTDTPDD